MSERKSGSAEQVLAVGGCHLTGYIVGEERSFLNIAFSSAGWRDTSYRASKPVPISRAVDVARLVAEGIDPDVIVLQLGNYETGRSLSLSLPTASTLNVRDEGLPPADTQASLLLPFLRALLKTGPLFLLWARGRPHVNVEALAAGIERALVDIQREFPSAQLVVVGTFPDADFHVLAARRRLNALLEALAYRFNSAYLDPIQVLGSPTRSRVRVTRCRFMADANHLNSDGHKALGIALGKVLQTLKARPAQGS